MASLGRFYFHYSKRNIVLDYQKELWKKIQTKRHEYPELHKFLKTKQVQRWNKVYRNQRKKHDSEY